MSYLSIVEEFEWKLVVAADTAHAAGYYETHKALLKVVQILRAEGHASSDPSRVCH